MRRLLLRIACMSMLITLMTISVGAQGFENFDNLGITGTSYQDGTFLGQDGSTWTFWQSRGDFSITGKSIMLGRNRSPQAEVYSGTISGGIGDLNFDYQQAYSTNVNLNVEVNGSVVGNVTSSSQPGVVLNSGTITVNVSGDFFIRFISANNSDGQVVIDNVSWTGYSGPTATPNPTATPTPIPPSVTIFQIQNTSDPSGDSPYVGQTVITTGIVTAFEDGDSNMFIQDGTGAWNGVLMYQGSGWTGYAEGDELEVTADVAEYNGLTELTNCSVTVLSTGNPLPALTTVTTLNMNQEMYEGVLCEVTNVTVTNEDLGFGEWEVDDSSGPAVVDDQYSYTYVPALNDVLDFVRGPITYSYGAFKMLPRYDADIQVSTVPTATPTTGPTVTPTPTMGPPPDVIINEIDADTVGTDADEFIELYDGGTGNTDLTGLVVVLFNGSNDASYDAIDLDGYSTNSLGYFVIGSATVPNVDLAYFTTNGLQNGADAVALFQGNASEFPGNTPVTTTNLIDAVVYDTNDPDDTGLLVLLNPGEPQINEAANGSSDIESIGRCPNGSGGARNTNTYTTGNPTSGGDNDCPTAPTATPTETPTPIVDTIYNIQFTTDPSGDSPYDGLLVTTTGIVTAFEDGNSNMFIQDGTGAWNGINMYQSGGFTGYALGDELQVTAIVDEYNGLTELTNCAVTVQSTGNPLPAFTTVTSVNMNQEMYESVLCEMVLVTVTNEDLGFGEWEVDDSSGPAVIDDVYSYTYTPTLGELLDFVRGPVNYSFGAYKMEPRFDADIQVNTGATPTPTSTPTGPTPTPTSGPPIPATGPVGLGLLLLAVGALMSGFRRRK